MSHLQARTPHDNENERVEMEVDEEGWPGKGVSPGSLPGYSHPFEARLGVWSVVVFVTCWLSKDWPWLAMHVVWLL